MNIEFTPMLVFILGLICAALGGLATKVIDKLFADKNNILGQSNNILGQSSNLINDFQEEVKILRTELKEIRDSIDDWKNKYFDLLSNYNTLDNKYNALEVRAIQMDLDLQECRKNHSVTTIVNLSPDPKGTQDGKDNTN